MSETTVHTFDDVMARMDDIVAAVRAKDASLEHSLDLFDEAIAYPIAKPLNLKRHRRRMIRISNLQ